MAYEQLEGMASTITLGGTNKKTGKPNPTQVEGYLTKIEEVNDRFNPGETQKLYTLQTSKGIVGLYGKTDIDRKLSTAKIGAMTKIATTNETKDTGKGFPMKVYYVAQDKSNVLDSGTSEYESVPSHHDDGESDDSFQAANSPLSKVKAALASRTSR